MRCDSQFWRINYQMFSWGRRDAAAWRPRCHAAEHFSSHRAHVEVCKRIDMMKPHKGG
jgi:hypothetical protein